MIIVLSLVFLLILGAGFIQTGWFKAWLKDRIIVAVKPHINGQLSIRSVGGNIFTTLAFHDLKVTRADSVVLRVDDMYASYNPFGLLAGRIWIRHLNLHTPMLRLEKKPDGHWDLADLTGSTSSGAVPEKAHASFPFREISIRSLSIRSGGIEIRGADSAGIRLPRSVRRLRSNLSFAWSRNRIAVTLNHLAFQTRSPDFNIKNIRTDFVRSSETLSLRNTKIQTDSSLVWCDLEIANFANPTLNISVSGKPIYFPDAGKWKTNLKIRGESRFEFRVHGPFSGMNFSLNAHSAGGSIDLKGKANLKNKPAAYRFSCHVNRFNPADIWEWSNLNSNLNFTFEGSGTGTEWGNIEAGARFLIGTSSLRNGSIRSGLFDATIRGHQVSLTGHLNTPDGSIRIRNAIFRADSIHTYALNAAFRNVDLGDLMPAGPSTRMNFTVKLSGRGTDLESASGRCDIRVDSSFIEETRIDTAIVRAVYADKQLELTEFLFSSPGARMNADGLLGKGRTSKINFDASIRNMADLTGLFISNPLEGEGRIHGEISGRPDSAAVHGRFDFARLETGKTVLRELAGNFKGLLNPAGNLFEIDARCENIRTLFLDHLSTNLTIRYADTTMHFDIEVQNRGNLYIRTGGSLTQEAKGLSVRFSGLEIRLDEQDWHNQTPEILIASRHSVVAISGLTMKSGAARMSLSGRLSRESASDIVFRADSLDIRPLARLLGREANMDGFLHLKAALTGTPESPLLQLQFGLDNLAYSKSRGESISGRVYYANDRLTGNVQIMNPDSAKITEFTGMLPVTATLFPFESNIRENDSLEISMYARDLNLSIFQTFLSEFRGIEGRLNADVRINNTVNDLRGSGPLSIAHGEMVIPRLGTRYRNVELKIVLNDKEITIDRLRVGSGNGYLWFQEGSLPLSKQTFGDFSVVLNTRLFKIMDTQKLDASVNGTLELSGSPDALIIKSNFMVPEARMYLPEWLHGKNTMGLESRPFFVVGPDSLKLNPNGALRFQKETPEIRRPFTQTGFYRNLEMDVSLDFKRNTWIRSENINVEVQGGLDLIKEGNRVRLFGTLNMVRGYFNLQARRFRIVEGKVAFHGGAEINPDINIEASYSFREQTTEGNLTREIRVFLSGTMSEPQFRFTLDGEEAEPRDVLSILLFGQTFSNLPLDHRNSAAFESTLGSGATGWIAGRLMNRLSSRIGSELNLDILQIESGENLLDSQIRIGKYITSDVFVTVSQDFSAEGNQEIGLEYEIPQKILFFNLFLQASRESKGNTGLDVIWKVDW